MKLRTKPPATDRSACDTLAFEPRSSAAPSSSPAKASGRRGRYFTILQAVEAYPGVLTERLIRRLVAERRIAYSYAGRRVVLAEADIEAYLDANRHEPLQGPCAPPLGRLAPRPGQRPRSA
ncbi:MAG TPA: hypothetical protein VK975_07540 [Acidimicrobiales bacterium]|nr:hypothetical protein [Acidimicrobiales bacterium]